MIMLFILLILVLAGCSHADDSLTVCKTEPWSKRRYKSITMNSARIDTLYVYHKDGYVTKSILVQENVLVDGG